MELTAALVKEQGVVFGVVLVKPYVVDSQAESNNMLRSLRGIRDFQHIPVVLAAQRDTRVLYRGRDDIVRFLQNVPVAALPWQKYIVS